MKSTGPPKLNVLVLDDDADLREALVDSLAFEGFSSRGAETVQQATEIVRSGSIDAVLVDLRLADGELGSDFIRRFIVDELPPMVILSSSIELATDLMAEFDLAWVKKPFDIEVVVRAIHAAVARPPRLTPPIPQASEAMSTTKR